MSIQLLYLGAVYGDTLTDITFPVIGDNVGRFEWDMPDNTLIGIAGTQRHGLNFISNDEDAIRSSYRNITVMVSHKPITITGATHTMPYNGETLAIGDPVVLEFNGILQADEANVEPVINAHYIDANAGTVNLEIRSVFMIGTAGVNYDVVGIRVNDTVVTLPSTLIVIGDPGSDRGVVKAMPDVFCPTTSTITYGDPLPASTFSGSTQNIDGNFSWAADIDLDPDTTYPLVDIDLTVLPRDLTVEGLIATSRIYDGGTTAQLSGSAALVKRNGLLDPRGLIEGDDVILETGSVAVEFEDADVGVNKPVTITGLTISGARAHNYNLIQPTNVTATIHCAPIASAAVTIGGAAMAARKKRYPV